MLYQASVFFPSHSYATCRIHDILPVGLFSSLNKPAAFTQPQNYVANILYLLIRKKQKSISFSLKTAFSHASALFIIQ